MGPHQPPASCDPFFPEPAVAAAIHSLGKLLRARDITTYAHSFRLIFYASKIGEVLNLSPDRLHTLQCGAFLHDIGKLLVHEQIRSKPAPLSDPEWSVMRQHPASGYRIAAAASVPNAVASIALMHHEWHDGSGYPLGLKGRMIPLEARICAVVDMLDALTSRRSYRQPISFEDAAATIEAESGTHFDPLVVDAFLSVPVEIWAGLCPANVSHSPTAEEGLCDRFDKPNIKVIRFAGAHSPHFSDSLPHHMPCPTVHISC
ncbi:MAG: HD-GYP domain-containing protein [Nitrospira sp.]|nr:HD-GYP domain-containing protein [Nitrospira sp.]